MATITDNTMTAVDIANQTDPKGGYIQVVNTLAMVNVFLQDWPWEEANGASYHKLTRTISLPTSGTRRYDKGYARSKSRTRAEVENMSMRGVWSVVDAAKMKRHPNPKQGRLDEAKLFLEGLSQDHMDDVIYGNEATDPEQYTGLAPRLNDLAQDNVFDAGDSGGNHTSIYVVCPGKMKVGFIYPKTDETYGIRHKDMTAKDGTTVDTDADGNEFPALKDLFEVECGIAVYRDDCIARIANIDPDPQATTNAFDPALMIELLNNMYMEGQDAIIYVNQNLATQMEIMALDRDNGYFIQTIEKNIWDQLKPVTRFRGRPIRVCHRILDTEDEVS